MQGSHRLLPDHLVFQVMQSAYYVSLSRRLLFTYPSSRVSCLRVFVNNCLCTQAQSKQSNETCSFDHLPLSVLSGREVCLTTPDFPGDIFPATEETRMDCENQTITIERNRYITASYFSRFDMRLPSIEDQRNYRWDCGIQSCRLPQDYQADLKLEGLAFFWLVIEVHCISP